MQLVHILDIVDMKTNFLWKQALVKSRRWVYL